MWVSRIVWGAIFCVAVSGCALSYVDSRGATHVLGLVKLTIEPGTSGEQLAGDSVQIRSVGVSVYSTPLNSGVVIGYNHETLMAVRNDSVFLRRSPKVAPQQAED